MSNSRRGLSVRTAELGMLILVLSASVPAQSSEAIIGATFGPVSVNKATVGDIWTSTWAADGTIYALQDDSMLPDGSTANVAVNRLEGDDPLKLTYGVVNPMKEYGTAGQEFGSEGNLERSGIISVDRPVPEHQQGALFVVGRSDAPDRDSRCKHHQVDGWGQDMDEDRRGKPKASHVSRQAI